MDIYFIIVLILLLFHIIWYSYKKNLVLKYRYKFFGLRDKLRNEIIEGNIKKNDWTFDYLDSTLSKIVCKLDSITLWNAIILYLKYRNDNGFQSLSNNLHKRIVKNKSIEEIYVEFGVLLIKYVYDRHIILTLTLKFLSNIFTTLASTKKKLKEAISELRETPETSTSLNYVR